jgi:hypothetical protein
MYGTFSQWNEVKIIIVGDQVWVTKKSPKKRECGQKLVPAQFEEESS